MHSQSSERALDGHPMPDPTRQQALLTARARQLALRLSSADSAPADSLLVVTFRLGSEEFGVACEHVREVARLKGLTPLPRTPSFVLGVMNVRGQVLSVVDLRGLLGLPAAGLVESARVVVLHHGAMEFGLVAEAVLAVRTVPLQDLQPPPATVTGIGANYLRGVTSDGLSLLDTARILADPDLVLDEPGGRASPGQTGGSS